MVYSIESGKFIQGPTGLPVWDILWSVEFDSFDEAKANMFVLSESLIEHYKFHKELNSQFRMVDDSSKQPVRIYHYITVNYPNVTLPSKEL